MLTSTETSLRGTKRQDITYVRAALRRRPLQLSLLLNKGLVFNRQASISLTLTHPWSKRPSSRRLSRCSGAWYSPPMMIAGQKQLNPCPIFERATTVDNTEVVNSSKNLRASRWNSRCKYELPILLRAANTRVPARNSPLAIGANLEWFGNT